jgi:hypothetical protein
MREAVAAPGDAGKAIQGKAGTLGGGRCVGDRTKWRVNTTGLEVWTGLEGRFLCKLCMGRRTAGSVLKRNRL